MRILELWATPLFYSQFSQPQETGTQKGVI